jgi:ABC-2 type transport system ATP-binding protein
MRMEVIEVSKVIRKHTVLDRVSCSMHSGKIYGIQGINGSGKTMLMRVLIGLIHPSSGKVLIDGKELGKELEFPKSIGFLLENPTFLDRYSGYQNLKMLASVKKIISDEEINKVLCLVGLDEEAAKKKYRKYSLGMKQRLGIAAALMEKPDIVILDEPTNALDTSGVELVKEIVRGEKKRGALVIISCHDLAVLEENECAKGTGSWIRQMDTEGQYELIRELLEPEFGPMYVTPPDIDQSVQQLSFTISEGIHRAVFEL